MTEETTLILEALFYILLIVGSPFIARFSYTLWNIIFRRNAKIDRVIIEVEHNGEVVSKTITISNDDELIEALLHVKRSQV